MTAEPLEKQGFVGLLGAARKGEPGAEFQRSRRSGEMLGQQVAPPEATGPGTGPKFSWENGNKAGGLAEENTNTGYITSAGQILSLALLHCKLPQSYTNSQ